MIENGVGRGAASSVGFSQIILIDVRSGGSWAAGGRGRVRGRVAK